MPSTIGISQPTTFPLQVARLQREYLWDVLLPDLGLNLAGIQGLAVSQLCQGVSFGDYNIEEVSDMRFGPYQAFFAGLFKVPTVTLTFLKSSPDIVGPYFDAWKQLIIDKGGLYHVKANYQKTIYVRFLDQTGLSIANYKLIGTFPTKFPSYDFDYDKDGIVKLQIELRVDRLEYDDLTGYTPTATQSGVVNDFNLNNPYSGNVTPSVTGDAILNNLINSANAQYSGSRAIPLAEEGRVGVSTTFLGRTSYAPNPETQPIYNYAMGMLNILSRIPAPEQQVSPAYVTYANNYPGYTTGGSLGSDSIGPTLTIDYSPNYNRENFKTLNSNNTGILGGNTSTIQKEVVTSYNNSYNLTNTARANAQMNASNISYEKAYSSSQYAQTIKV